MPRPINERMKIFADEYLTGAHTGQAFNGYAAARHAKYPEQYASRLLKHPGIAEYIKERLEEHHMSANEVLKRFTDIARAKVGNVVTTKQLPNGQKALDIDPDKVLEFRDMIRDFGFDANGNPKVSFHDSHAALRDIARVLGMMKDGLEVSGPGGGPVEMRVVFVDPDDELEAPEPDPEPEYEGDPELENYDPT